MTNREEAILGLKELRDWEGLPYCIEEPIQREGVAVITQEVIDFAIEALEQTELNPSYNSIKTELDCVSRQAVLDYAKDTCLDLDKYEDTEVFCDEIKALPSVTPTSEDIKEAYLKGYDYGVKDWFKSKTQPCEDCRNCKRRKLNE